MIARWIDLCARNRFLVTRHGHRSTSSLLFPVSIPAQIRVDFCIFHDPAL